jgi:hypothetical protein
MPIVLYTHPWMLSGLAALSVPVIIHLLLRRKKKRLPFSTLQFFVKQDQQSSQRRKLRNWLLLALRLLLVALLVTAFARPFLAQRGALPATRQRRQAIFVLDRSASMLAVGTDGQRWTRARELMQHALGALDGNDRAALVGCSSHTEILSGFVEPASLARTIAAVQPAYGTSSLAEGLQQAAKLASTGDPGTATTIYVVSDLQRSACQNLESCPIPADLNVQLLCAGDFYAPNLSITELDPQSYDGANPRLVVSNFSDEDNAEATVEFAIDSKVLFSSRFNLKAGGATNIGFALPALKPGWHDARAWFQAEDSLEIDNTRYAVLFVPEPVHALVVESRKTSRVFQQDSFFLASALDPTQGSTNPLPTDFTVARIAPEDIAGRLSASRGREPCDIVILPGLRNIPDEASHALKGFVREGGGLLMFLGQGISANRYNSEFQGLLPAQLGAVEVAPDGAVGWRIGEFNTNAGAFAVFTQPESGDLAIPQFFKRCALTPAAGATAMAYFEDGLPLVVAGAAGRGQVALVNSSADTSWNDWPKHKTFVPWLHGLGKQLAPRTAHRLAPETKQVLTGDDLEFDLAANAPTGRLVLQGPGGQKWPLVADERSRLHASGSFMPGIYSVRDEKDREIQRLAVNLPPHESDLAALQPPDFQRQLVRIQDPPRTSRGTSLFGSKTGQQEFWRLLLLGVLGLLLMETLVSNRTPA